MERMCSRKKESKECLKEKQHQFDFGDLKEMWVFLALKYIHNTYSCNIKSVTFAKTLK